MEEAGRWEGEGAKLEQLADDGEGERCGYAKVEIVRDGLGRKLSRSDVEEWCSFRGLPVRWHRWIRRLVDDECDPRGGVVGEEMWFGLVEFKVPVAVKAAVECMETLGKDLRELEGGVLNEEARVEVSVLCPPLVDGLESSGKPMKTDLVWLDSELGRGGWEMESGDTQVDAVGWKPTEGVLSGFYRHMAENRFSAGM